VLLEARLAIGVIAFVPPHLSNDFAKGFFVELDRYEIRLEPIRIRVQTL